MESVERIIMSNNHKNANGVGSIRKRPDGRWEARYTTGFDPDTGKPIRKSIYGKTQKAVREQLTATQADLDRGTYIEPSKMTLEEYLAFWMDTYSVDKRFNTLKGYKASIKNHILPALGDYYLEELTPLILQQFFNDLGRPDEDGTVLAPKTVKNVFIVLRAALYQAVDNELVRSNPCKKVRLAKVNKMEISPLSDEQIHDFMLIAPCDKLYGTLLTVILFTGLREGEGMGLTWDCIDFEKGTLYINKQLQRLPLSAGGMQLTPTKNGKSRTLHPAPFVMDMLKVRYVEQEMQRQLAGDAWEAWHTEAERKKALVFTNEVGRCLVPKRVYLHFKAIADEIGAPDARVHDLRHTYAVISLQNGDDVKTLQENLGHASAAFTLDVYGHVTARMKQESASRMENFYSNLMAT